MVLHEGSSDRVRREGSICWTCASAARNMHMGGVYACVCGWGMMMGEQGVRYSLSMHLYGEGEEAVTYLHT